MGWKVEPSDLSKYERALLEADSHVTEAMRAANSGADAKAQQEMDKAIRLFQRLAKANQAAVDAGKEDPYSVELPLRAAQHFDLVRRRWSYRPSTWKRGERAFRGED